LSGRYLYSSILLAFAMLTMPAAMSGCSGGSGGQQQNAQLQAAQKKISEEKESEKLKKLEEDIESLFETLGGPALKTKTGGGQEGKQGEESNQAGGQQEEKPQEDKQKEDGQKEGGQQEEKQQEGQKEGNNEGKQQQVEQKSDIKKDSDAWKKVDKTISSLHYQWNDLMPEITKKGADMKLVDAFDNSLNSLTTESESRDRSKVLTSANRLYSHIPDLFSLYRLKMSPELKRMVYYTRNMMLESEKDNWEQVGKDKESLEKSWSLLRNTLEDEQKKTGDKLDFSIYELKKVVSENNKQLAFIKGRIVLNNINELLDTFKESK
jgi:hypothetical protein